MDFVDQAGPLRELVEDGLAGLFAPGGLLAADSVPVELGDAMRYALAGGGKRLRPVLCLATCQAVCGDPVPALPFALAIELLHNYTLVHDDLPCMDDDAMRRGRPSVQAKFGEAQAVLVGDALQAAAFRAALVGAVDSGESARLRAVLAFDRFAEAAGAGGVVGGQWVDVTSVPPHPAERVRHVHEHKTGDLIRCACETGAICGGAPVAARSAAARYGERLGLAFQIVDDLLDSSNPDKAGELSVLSVVTPERARELAADCTREALSALSELRACAPAARGGVSADSSSSSVAAAALLEALARDQLARSR